MTKTYRTSVAGTLLDRGKATRESVLNALPGTCREVVSKTGLGKSTVKNALRQLIHLGVVAVTDKRLVNKNLEFIYSPLTDRIPTPHPKKVLKTFTDPQRHMPSHINATVRQMVSRDPRNIWERPVYTPPKWEPTRQQS